MIVKGSIVIYTYIVEKWKKKKGGLLIFIITENFVNENEAPAVPLANQNGKKLYSYCPKGQGKEVYLFDSTSRGICKYAWFKSSNKKHSPKYWNADSMVDIVVASSSVISLIYDDAHHAIFLWDQ